MKYKVDPLVYQQIGDGNRRKKGAKPPKQQPTPPGKEETPSSRVQAAPEPASLEKEPNPTRDPGAHLLPEQTMEGRVPKAPPAAPRPDRRAAHREMPKTDGALSRGESAPKPRQPLRQGGRKLTPEEVGLRRSQIFLVASFLGMLFLFGGLSLALPKPTVSEYERRELAPMPEFSVHELFWGSYLRDVEAHYADTFPMRDVFVQAAARVDEMRGIRIDGVRIIESTPAAPVTPQETAPPPDSPPPDGPGDPEDSTPQEEALVPFQMEDDGAEGERTENGLFIYKGRAMDIYGGNAAEGTRYAQVLNRYAAAFPGGVRTFDIVVPTSIEFYLPERYRSITNPQKPQIEHIYGQLEGVTGVDAYTNIQNHAGEYLYFNTDHHWTGLGAYYAYTAYCEAAGLTPLTMDDYDVRTLPQTFLGTFYSQSYDTALRNSADTVEYYVIPGDFQVVRYEKANPTVPVASEIWAEYASGGNSYGVFLGGDFPLIHIKTENTNGRSVVLVKESFGNAFAPFLAAHYQEVYVVDLRYYQGGLVSLVQENGIDDVIFLNNAFAANTGSRINDLEGMLR